MNFLFLLLLILLLILYMRVYAQLHFYNNNNYYCNFSFCLLCPSLSLFLDLDLINGHRLSVACARENADSWKNARPILYNPNASFLLDSP